MVQIAGADPLRDEGIALAERMRGEGVPTEMHVYRGMPHCFYIFEGHRATTEYYQRVVEFVKRIANGSAEAKRDGAA